MLRERFRLYLKLEHTPFQNSILYRAMRLIRQEAEHDPDGYKAPNARTSWLLRTMRLLREYQARFHVELGQPVHPWECGAEAAVAARAIGILEWQERVIRKVEKEHGQLPQPWVLPLTAESEASKEVAAASLAFGYGLTAEALGKLARFKAVTALSVRAPGCSGAVIGGASRALPAVVWRVLLGARTGREGWHRVRDHVYKGDSLRALEADPTCKACGAGFAGPIHAITECAYPPMVALRREVTGTLPAMVQHLTRMALDATRADIAMAAGLELPELHPAHVRAAADAQDWTSPEGKFVLFRLLIVAPWTAASPHLPPGPLTRALGELFDAFTAKNHLARPARNMWLSWAAGWLVKFHSVYYAEWDRQARPVAATA